MTLVIPSPATRTLAVAGRTQRFPVNRVFCVGRNYAAHAREMGADPDREPPFFFMKPAQAVVDAQRPVCLPFPPRTQNLHHEVELVVAMGVGGADIPVHRALDHVFGYAVGLDMTRRDLQNAAKAAGRPWEFGKSFAGSAPMGVVHPAADLGHPGRAAIGLEVDGVRKQHADLADMIWGVAECIAELSAHDALEPGDLIMTGTPEGVGPVRPGQTLRAFIEGLGTVVLSYASAEEQTA